MEETLLDILLLYAIERHFNFDSFLALIALRDKGAFKHIAKQTKISY